MFESLTQRINDAVRTLQGRGRISENNVKDALREVRTALLEADVNLKVVRDFIDTVQKKALGQKVLSTLHPGQVMIKVIHDELVEMMGPVSHDIPRADMGATVIMLAGLQGSGKTTTCGKLARYLTEKGRKVLMVAADLQRPAAVEQLRVLGQQLDIPVYCEDTKDPVGVAQRSLAAARKQGCDTVLLDTAGRLHIDDDLMAELERVAKAVHPHQIYLVCDAMTGQDAVNSAREFNQRLELDGVILTKLDGDARGGAAVSVKAVTGKPIKFIGVGEKLDRLEEFHPDRMAGRILGMGDVVTLVEKAQATVDAAEAQKMQEKLQKAEFTFEDFQKQLQQMRKLGSMREVLSMIPGLGSQLAGLPLDDHEMVLTEAIIQSMTPRERQQPDLIGASRRRRIARGAGVPPQEVAGLVKSFEQVRDMVKQMSGAGLFSKDRSDALRAMQGIDLFGRGSPRKKLRSKRKKKDRKRRSR
ncbi:MAG TPA: signal recognition particle protein [Phycisphaerae bacterium]|nr:signal recognition particle protein [Phycisphaerae bacterium]